MESKVRLIDLAYEINLDYSKLDWKEISGDKSNPLITACYRAVDGLGDAEKLDDSKVAWCSCYMNRVIQKAGGKGTRKATARSWLTWGRESTGIPGDVVVLKRGDSKWQGHVGQLVKKGLIYIYVLGGNQDNTVNVSKFYRFNVLGYRTSTD